MARIRRAGRISAQFLRDTPPFNTLEDISKWFADLSGYTGVQIPGSEPHELSISIWPRVQQPICDELMRPSFPVLDFRSPKCPPILRASPPGMHPAYDVGLAELPSARTSGRRADEWAAGEVRKCIDASAKLRLAQRSVLSGGFAWQ